MLQLALIGAAFADDPALPPADLVVVAKVASAKAAEPLQLYDVVHTLDFQAVVPPSMPQVVCLKVSEVLAGELFGDDVCFVRVNGLALATWDVATKTDALAGREAVFFLREAHFGDLMYADLPSAVQPVDQKDQLRLFVANPARSPAKPAPITPPAGEPLAKQVSIAGLDAIAVLRTRITKGTPAEKREAYDAVCDYGVLPALSDVIAAITDASPLIAKQGDLIGKPVGLWAADALNRLAPALDGEATRPKGHFTFEAGGFDHANRSAAVQDDWKSWWKDYRDKGPAVADDKGGPDDE